MTHPYPARLPQRPLRQMHAIRPNLSRQSLIKPDQQDQAACPGDTGQGHRLERRIGSSKAAKDNACSPWQVGGDGSGVWRAVKVGDKPQAGEGVTLRPRA